jgi:hypothetical protein
MSLDRDGFVSSPALQAKLNISPFPLHQRGFPVALIGFVFSTSSTSIRLSVHQIQSEATAKLAKGANQAAKKKVSLKIRFASAFAFIAPFAVAFASMPDRIETPPHNLSNRQQIALRRSAAIVHFRALSCIRRSRLRGPTGAEFPGLLSSRKQLLPISGARARLTQKSGGISEPLRDFQLKKAMKIILAEMDFS